MNKRCMALLAALALSAGMFSAGALENGDKGSEVKTLQKALYYAGYLTEEADGHFGNDTEEAVKAFQRSRGLEETGVADEALTGLLYELSPVKGRWFLKEFRPSDSKSKDDPEITLDIDETVRMTIARDGEQVEEEATWTDEDSRHCVITLSDGTTCKFKSGREGRREISVKADTVLPKGTYIFTRVAPEQEEPSEASEASAEEAEPADREDNLVPVPEEQEKKVGIRVYLEDRDSGKTVMMSTLYMGEDAFRSVREDMTAVEKLVPDGYTLTDDGWCRIDYADHAITLRVYADAAAPTGWFIRYRDSDTEEVLLEEGPQSATQAELEAMQASDALPEAVALTDKYVLDADGRGFSWDGNTCNVYVREAVENNGNPWVYTGSNVREAFAAFARSNDIAEYQLDTEMLTFTGLTRYNDSVVGSVWFEGTSLCAQWNDSSAGDLSWTKEDSEREAELYALYSVNEDHGNTAAVIAAMLEANEWEQMEVQIDEPTGTGSGTSADRTITFTYRYETGETGEEYLVLTYGGISYKSTEYR